MAEGIRTLLSQAAGWLAAQRQGADVEFQGVSTDSRTIAHGNLFVALRGPNHDGHEHIAMALEKGAVAVLVSQPHTGHIPQIIVDDTRIALGRLAAAWRQQLGLPLAAVTGSNGKTTTKEMMASVLAQCGTVLATRGNLNNDIGVPLTLLRLEPSCRYGVIEMGANHAGEIAYLTALTRPDVALITNAAGAHLEGFGSLDGVAKAKGEIFGGLREDGTAVINADDHYSGLWRELSAGRKVLTFAMDSAADVKGQWQGDADGSRLQVGHGGEQMSIRLAMLGEHNARNALAACAVALALGIDKKAIVAGLEAVQPVGGRLQTRNGLNGARIIDDSYNANPASLLAGLKVLAACQGERILALGDMAELGDQAAQLHAEAGSQAAALGIDRIYASGRLSRYAVEAFGGRGEFFERQEDLIEAMRPELHEGVTVLVKGSRSSHMERVVEALGAGAEG